MALTPILDSAHLYGGPLDGSSIEIGSNTSAFADEKTQSIYSYCPNASKQFDRTTFTHSSISHDAFSD